MLDSLTCNRDFEAAPGVSDKQTYTISELAKAFGVTPRTIRFYEEKGLVSPARQGQKRLYSAADRVRIKLILRGKRIGLSLDESADIIDMYDPEHHNTEQLHVLIDKVQTQRQRFQQQRRDIDDILANLDEIEALCQQALDNNTDIQHPTDTAKPSSRSDP